MFSKFTVLSCKNSPSSWQPGSLPETKQLAHKVSIVSDSGSGVGGGGNGLPCSLSRCVLLMVDLASCASAAETAAHLLVLGHALQEVAVLPLQHLEAGGQVVIL